MVLKVEIEKGSDARIGEKISNNRRRGMPFYLKKFLPSHLQIKKDHHRAEDCRRLFTKL